jgi:oligoribonuclease NrnB/cAMP/cGMP phosphodiesterase (DHH superfamily)
MRGIAVILGQKPDTILSWPRQAAEHSEEVDAFLLQDLKVSKVELEELWTSVKKKRLREWKIRLTWIT